MRRNPRYIGKLRRAAPCAKLARMDVGRFVDGNKRNRGLVLIWLAGAIAVCRSALATIFPAIRSALNL